MRHVFAFALLAAAVLVAGCTNEVGITCPPGQTLCGTVCVFTTQDPQNCGSCGNVCTGDTLCIGGVCGCPKGQMACDGKCVDIKSDVGNCGACGNACPVPQVCSMSACADTCGTGLTNCNRNCVDLNTDDRNCGMCGNACGTAEKCTGGACVPECPTGQMLCSGKCVNLTNDGQNCGACGNVCPNDFFCVFGTCILGCPQPLTRCGATGPSDGGTSCVDTRFDPNNCGGCGGADVSPQPTPSPDIKPHVCGVTDGRHTDPVCDNGRCAAACEDGFFDCRFYGLPNGGGGEGPQPLRGPNWSAPPEPQGRPTPQPPAEMACYDFQNDPCSCGGCFMPVRGFRILGQKGEPEPICFDEGLAETGATAGLCCNGVPTALDGDFFGSGSCGSSCADAAPCPSSAPSCCQTGTPTGHACIDTNTDVLNCGNCGNDCTAGPPPTSPPAVSPAPACCGGGCTDLNVDNANCGSCNNDCNQGPNPSPGGCCPGINPAPGPGESGASCVSFLDVHRCGGCDIDCTVICPSPAPSSPPVSCNFGCLGPMCSCDFRCN